MYLVIRNRTAGQNKKLLFENNHWDPAPWFYSKSSFLLSALKLTNTPITIPTAAGLILSLIHISTLDLNDIPQTDEGKVDFSQDFFCKPTNLTVSGQLNAETYAMAFRNVYTLSLIHI